MKFAFLIIAHKNPSQLYRLVQSLDDGIDQFYIHIDASVALAPFRKVFRDCESQVHFCQERVLVKWGRYSMIRATMALIKQFFDSGFDADYLHLLSGQDYPLKNRGEIKHHLKANFGKNFLDSFSLPDPRWPMGLNRIRYRWAVNEKEDSSYSDLDYWRNGSQTKALPSGTKFYGGSQWWSLHIECARFVLEKYLVDDIMFRFFKHALIPDEMLFQTLILNSRFKDTVINDNLRYIKWEKNRSHPETLGTEHFDEMLESGKLFARKFLTGSDDVLSKIDSRLTKGNGDETEHSQKKRWCVISAVGKSSLHKHWIKGSRNFDLHLLVYDDDCDHYSADADFIDYDKGFKFRLVYNYLAKKPWLLDGYDYFFVPDDDIFIDIQNIHALFGYMVEYKLDIAQPALYRSYHSYPHTVHRPGSILRFTNFVEIMQPCFSRDALKEVLFTFNENRSGWGIDFHWGELINFREYNMAVIDSVFSMHTRPIRSNNPENQSEFRNYLQKYKLTPRVIEIK